VNVYFTVAVGAPAQLQAMILDADACSGAVNFCTGADSCSGAVNYCNGRVSVLT